MDRHPVVTLAHGGGGRLMHRLIEDLFRRAFSNPLLDAAHDGAVFEGPGGRMAFTTDAHVVRPIFFPGGDIGRLAVWGTVNDLAMCGARPLHLSAAFVLEEGFPMEDLWRVVLSMREAAEESGVSIVTGDTKVVERGKGDGVYITTAGVGRVPEGVDVRPARVRPGDAIVLSGDLGRHGMAIMTRREGLTFESEIRSDLAPLTGPVQSLLGAGVDVHCLRDVTRGGLAAVLHEIAAAAAVEARIREDAVAVDASVRAACEILGIDPLNVACEGRFVAFVPQGDAARAVEALRSHTVSAGAVVAGHVRAGTPGRVVLTSALGTERLVDLPAGAALPRIC
ncbi:MAG: hydrogenase expression/formation protein HypE [Myxococcales bacterium]|nr:hydrogenase expression/formation protein HypE [Myxococcales bacterium]